MGYVTVNGTAYHVPAEVRKYIQELEIKTEEPTFMLPECAVRRYSIHHTCQSVEEMLMRTDVNLWVSHNLCDGDPLPNNTEMTLDANDVAEMIGDCITHLATK